MNKLMKLAIAFAMVTAASSAFARTSPAAANCNKQSKSSLFAKTAYEPKKKTPPKTPQAPRNGTT